MAIRMGSALLRSTGLALAGLVAACGLAQAHPADSVFDHSFMPHRARIGVSVQPMTAELRAHFGAPEDRGLLVVQVLPDRPAAKAGLAVGDVILAAGDTVMHRSFDLVRAVGRVREGQSLSLRVLRAKRELELEVSPEGRATAWVDPAHWGEWLEEGMRHGSRQLRQRLQELEERFRRLERRLDEQSDQET